MNPCVIRPVGESDLPGLIHLVEDIGGTGLTSLPPDQKFLHHKILSSLPSFHHGVHKPGGELYFFVLEDVKLKKIVGTCGLISKVGGFDPFYTYKIQPEAYIYNPVKVNKHVSVLHLQKNHSGASEVCSLFLMPEYRDKGLARLLSFSRFLFMAEFSERFDPYVIAEMRGFIDDDGRSPFWECVGRHFFDMDFYQADRMSGLGNKEFISALMPQYPIYIPLLPSEAQEVIGRVHRETEPAQGMLQQEGFTFADEVDIFDAGPILQTEIKNIRTVRESRKANLVRVVDHFPNEPVSFLVSNGKLDYRCTLASAQFEGEDILLTRNVAHLLKVQPGETVRFAPIH